MPTLFKKYFLPRLILTNIRKNVKNLIKNIRNINKTVFFKLIFPINFIGPKSKHSNLLQYSKIGSQQNLPS